MATSVVAHGKVKGAADRGEPIPEGWAVDPEGRPTTDPVQAMAGALLPFGGFKGSGVSLLVDLLAGALAGARSGPEIVPLYQRLAEPQGIGQFFLALNVAAFGPMQAFARRVDETVRRMRALPRATGVARIYAPGEPEFLRAAEYAKDGIPLPADALAEIARVAAMLGIESPKGR
jgi:ureidoglycolate dehydrogenase (NAD+)